MGQGGPARRFGRRWRALVLGGSTLAMGAVVLPACVPPTTFVVDTTADVVDADPGDGDCATAAGDCSLRAAVQEANADDDRSVIELAPGATYTLAIPNVSDDPTAIEGAAATGDLDMDTPIELLGHGATIDGAQLDRVLRVHGSTLDLRDTTITGGSALAGGGIRIGGGAEVRIDHSTVTGNTATGMQACGFGPFVLCFSDSFPSSRAPGIGLPDGTTYYDGGGGGIWSGGKLTMWSSTVSGNTSQGTSACYPVSSYQTCTLNSGGGIMVFGGTVSLSNMTLSGNSSPGGVGGAIGGQRAEVLGDSVRLLYSTVAGNTATALPANLTSTAGWRQEPSSISVWATLGATIVTGGATPACGRLVTSEGYNWFGDTSCGAGAHNVVGAPILGALADNGGPTLTHLPASLGNWIPIGELHCSSGVSDQRDLPRPQGSGCGIGAVEIEVVAG